MFKNEWGNILRNQDIRQSLSKIREKLKSGGDIQQLRNTIDEDEDILICLLESEDAKTRKNAALLMGDLGLQKFMEPIWKAYKSETQRFIKSAYLSAIGNFDYHNYLDELKAQLKILKNTELSIENEKHV